MQKAFVFLWAWLLLPVLATAQFSLSGTLKDSENQPLVGATVLLKNTYKGVSTDYKGHFLFKNLPIGNYVLEVSYVGYETQTREVQLSQNQEIEISLIQSSTLAAEVVVTATRASEQSGVVVSNISKEDLEKQNLGQDLPILLNFTPSAVTTSDAGAGVGYTGIRIRGSDGTRINVNVNGIPLNDSESQGVYWVNMPDFASSTQSIQIQRGVGTSTNGAGAFGATLNVQSLDYQKDASAEISNTYGSFNTLKHTIKASTGLLKDKFILDARLSKISSNGYVDRATSDLKSFYLSAGYYGNRNFLRLNVFSGVEKTYQSWYGILQDSLKTNRTYNIYTYDNQTDNYNQTHYQAIFSQEIGSKWVLNTALHYTKGLGYYEEYKENQKFEDYKLNNVVLGTDTLRTTDLIRRRWLNNDFYGITYSLAYTGSRFSGTFGGGANEYKGRHFGEIIWAKYASNSQIRQKYYENEAQKSDVNFYAKGSYALTEKLYVSADLQMRFLDYNYFNYILLQNENANFQFFNPKISVSYNLNDFHQFNLYYGIGQREPNRNDFINSMPQKRPKAEFLQNIEASYQFKSQKIALKINAYAMLYKNELVLTGQLNDVGESIRQNVAQSSRIGLETELALKISKKLTWNANFTMSENKVNNFTEVLYDENGADFGQNYTNTNLPFSPNIIAGSQISYKITSNFEATLLSKYVGKQYLDNTQSEQRIIKAYSTQDIRFSYKFKPKSFKELGVSLLVNNILNSFYESNGYTFGYLYGGQTFRENYYYPQAGTNFLAAITLKF
jgi:iron complex outermembrane recepter protein